MTCMSEFSTTAPRTKSTNLRLIRTISGRWNGAFMQICYITSNFCIRFCTSHLYFFVFSLCVFLYCL
ncbi:unnamed protein product, partial [Cylicocyclus nassatus]